MYNKLFVIKHQKLPTKTMKITNRKKNTFSKMGFYFIMVCKVCVRIFE
jgi:hypothetical protein